jgi:hypothetical protein
MKVLSDSEITNEDFLWAAENLPEESSSEEETAPKNGAADDKVQTILQLSQSSVKATQEVYQKIFSFVDQCLHAEDGAISNEKLLRFAKRKFSSEDFMILFAINSPLVIAQALTKISERGTMENMMTFPARVKLLEALHEIAQMSDPSVLFQRPEKSEE